MPIPTSSARIKKLPSASSNDLFTGTIGMAAGFFHPVTGYSLPWAVRVAEALSSLPQLSPATVASAFEKLNREFDQTESFYLLLNRLLFYGATTHNRRRIFERFYQLPPSTIQRFYAGQSNLGDRVRLLTGKPPIPILSAIKAILHQPKGRALKNTMVDQQWLEGESK